MVDEAVDRVGVEGRLTNVQLKQDHAKRPQVHLQTHAWAHVRMQAKEALGKHEIAFTPVILIRTWHS